MFNIVGVSWVSEIVEINGLHDHRTIGQDSAIWIGSGIVNRIYSNGGGDDFVINPFRDLCEQSSELYLAAPYFTASDLILEAVDEGKSVSILVGLNAATSPKALREVYDRRSVAVRYLTHRFHAKIYLFENAALLGSSNLTDGGLISNREAVIRLDRETDEDSVEEVRALFVELWDAGQVLTAEKLNAFDASHAAASKEAHDSDSAIEKAVGRTEPPNIRVGSKDKSRERLFLDRLQREVYEQYRPAFNEVGDVLEEHSLRRDDLSDLGAANETNRFLNYVRLTHVIGDDAWRTAPVRKPNERRAEIVRFGREWINALDNKVPEDFAARLKNVARIFGSAEAVSAASKEEIIEGLMSVHAFTEQSRFVHGGWDNLPEEFWQYNSNDVERVKSSLSNLLYGSGNFIQRLHDMLYDPSMKLGFFGYFCALELYGTVRPDECPPLNGRMAKALRYLGFSVKGA